MLTDGGLTGQKGVQDEGDIDPKCLAQMLRDGAGPKPDGLSPGMTTSAGPNGLATLFKGMKTDDCQKLKGLMTQGGLGTHLRR